MVSQILIQRVEGDNVIAGAVSFSGSPNGAATEIDRFYQDLENDEKFMYAFTSSVVSREEWSNLLRINRKTIWRWEQGIINRIRSLREEYWEESRIRSDCLDAYQRFIIAYIRSLKSRGHDYQSTRLSLIDEINQLTRLQFESWRKANDLH